MEDQHNEGQNDRRGFLKKFALAASAAIIGAKSGIGSVPDPSQKSPKQMVRNIKALGFQWETRDPFLFCVHHEDFYPKGNAQFGPDASLNGRNIGSDFMLKDGWRMYHGSKVPGFPGHPHRGFETITVVRSGMVDHSDSMGASGRYGNGDVQWMTAGKGLQHAEMFPLVHQDKDNPMELFQIWLNLPKANKFVEPHFKMLWSESIPITHHKDENGNNTRIEVVAGAIGTDKPQTPPPNSWATPAANEVAIWNIKMDANATWKLPPASAGINRTVYFYSGEQLEIEGQAIPHYHSAEVDPTSDLTLKNGNKEGNILILQGKPIAEPVVQHGPFVMNTRQEIQQAFTDYQQTQFGGWPWPENDPVHGTKGRFAAHADGTIENKG